MYIEDCSLVGCDAVWLLCISRLEESTSPCGYKSEELLPINWSLHARKLARKVLRRVDIRVKNYYLSTGHYMPENLLPSCSLLSDVYFLQSLLLCTKIRNRLPLGVLQRHAMKMCCGIEVLAHIRGAHIFQKSRSHF